LKRRGENLKGRKGVLGAVGGVGRWGWSHVIASLTRFKGKYKGGEREQAVPRSEYSREGKGKV